MTSAQKIIKYLAIGLAALLIVSIIGGILSAAGFLGGFFSSSLLDEDKVYSISGDIHSLKLDIAAADLKIVTGDALAVESNLAELTVKDSDGVLTVTQKSRFGINYNGAFLTITLPENFTFEDADITTGAGKVTIGDLRCNSLQLELGAGAVRIDYLYSKSDAQIKAGAGELVIDGGALQDLELELGVGKTDLSVYLSGDSKIQCGVGQTQLTLIGKNYTIDVDKGLGSVTIDGQDMEDGQIYGSGSNAIDLKCGVGSVDIGFLQES